ncbi:Metalloprotease [Trametes meyenii]|nr:Metalloprotease [Trametes meyenii]
MVLGSTVLLVLASAVSALADASLLLQVSGPSTVSDVDNLRVTATVTNTGDVPLKLLNDPYSPLSDLPTDIFTITNPHGTNPDFVGIEVKYVPHVAASSDDPLAFTHLDPGESVHVEHDLSLAYDFSTSGPGPYIINVKALNTFYYVNRGRISALLTGSGLPSHAVNITGSLESRARKALRPDTKGCEEWQEQAVHRAIPLAKTYIENALADLARDGFSGDNYKLWFGSPSEHRLATVDSHFEALNGNNFTDFTFVCNTAFCSSKTGVFAYVYPDDFGKIHVCDMFFRSPVGGPDSRASTIVHEASHFTRNGGTQDHAYGPMLTKELARSYPQFAVMNADNHEYFAASAQGGDWLEDPVILTQVYFGGEAFSA